MKSQVLMGPTEVARQSSHLLLEIYGKLIKLEAVLHESEHAQTSVTVAVAAHHSTDASYGNDKIEQAKPESEARKVTIQGSNQIPSNHLGGLELPEAAQAGSSYLPTLEASYNRCLPPSKIRRWTREEENGLLDWLEANKTLTRQELEQKYLQEFKKYRSSLAILTKARRLRSSFHKGEKGRGLVRLKLRGTLRNSKGALEGAALTAPATSGIQRTDRAFDRDHRLSIQSVLVGLPKS
ncbi:uncharacterized protein BDW43DRAFT_316399 [Aspergillus alliaceus]|uniref:uncharacterized protein n=1 Tax=Petromyces alliaceus TaxID=209559 RepID=UPI0012A561E4|nr:uncharacterized protein BDW43DRAFT_316399 [Aspergillus alliaceus]KAB8227886.1 hypothetical protein BDW43DRAFT_316399 [Aspergillus alliaceus]